MRANEQDHQRPDSSSLEKCQKKVLDIKIKVITAVRLRKCLCYYLHRSLCRLFTNILRSVAQHIRQRKHKARGDRFFIRPAPQ